MFRDHPTLAYLQYLRSDTPYSVFRTAGANGRARVHKYYHYDGTRSTSAHSVLLLPSRWVLPQSTPYSIRNNNLKATLPTSIYLRSIISLGQSAQKTCGPLAISSLRRRITSSNTSLSYCKRQALWFPFSLFDYVVGESGGEYNLLVLSAPYSKHTEAKWPHSGGFNPKTSINSRSATLIPSQRHMSWVSTSSIMQNGPPFSRSAKIWMVTSWVIVHHPFLPIPFYIQSNDHVLVMGKVESSPDAYKFSEHYLPWHAHITALTVAPAARRLGIGKILTEQLEAAAEANNTWFIDLFVRSSNERAIRFYKSMGYSVFRVVKDYYGDHATDPMKESEDAFDMRKPMSRDEKLQHIRDDGESHEVSPENVW